MKVKRVLRFYFSAERLNGAIDNLILKHALSSNSDADVCAERLCTLIYEKQALGELWEYLNAIISRLSDGEIKTLEKYALSRKGVEAGEIKELKRCVMKFRRRAQRLERFCEGLRLVGKYYCLM